MGNVLRVLGIIAVSMVISLTALFLVLFTICGGFQDRNVNGGIVLAVCGGIFAGGVALIVWIGRGIQGSRRMAQGAPAGGLAVPPAGAAPAYYQAPAAAARAAVAPLTGGDLQLLNVLRAALGLLAFVPIVMMAWSFPNYRHVTPGFGLYMAVQAVLNALPPAVLAFVLFRNPPPGVGVDATAGMTIASIVFRGLFFGYMVLSSRLGSANNLVPLFARLGMFTLLEAGITVLALVVRKRLGPMNPGALILAVFAFLFWEGLLQTVMTLLARMIY
jgi:hypothetical protein